MSSRKSGSEEATSSVASAEVSVGGEVLRGEARGGGPVDALEQALRDALPPAYPHLARVSLTDFRAQIARGGDASRSAVRVWITGTAEGSRPWTTIGSAPDFLPAAWLALADCLEFAIVSRAGVTATRPLVDDPLLGPRAPRGSQGGQQRMEPLWSPAGATRGNRANRKGAKW